MSTVTKSVEVSKEMSEVMDGIVGIAKAVKAAMADGWDTSSDLPVVVLAAVQHLGPAIQGVDLLDDEFKADRGAFIKAATLGVSDVVDAVLPAPAVNPAP